jgi:sialic acid synthase SpsE
MKLKVSKNLFISNKAKPIIIAEISANHCGKKIFFLNILSKQKKLGLIWLKFRRMRLMI